MKAQAYQVWFDWDGIKGYEIFYSKKRNWLDAFDSVAYQFCKFARKIGAVQITSVCEGTVKIYDGPIITHYQKLDERSTHQTLPHFRNIKIPEITQSQAQRILRKS